MTPAEEFHSRYAAALRDYVAAPGEASLAVGHELGRRALQEQISMLEIIENHFELVDELGDNSRPKRATALQFLLQTLAALDVATRGFLDGTRRYAQQRARADDLASRDEFRTALVNSLQEGFFVADHDGAVVEINAAFAEITGYGAADLPYRWPHPWVVDRATARERLSRLITSGHIESETPIRHADGHIAWVALSANAVTAQGATADAYVGTLRDITSARAAAAREGAVARLATAVSVANGVDEVLSIALDECRKALDVQRLIAVMWPADDGDPGIWVAGAPKESSWADLDPWLRAIFEDARQRLPLAVEPLGGSDPAGESRGIIAVLSGARDAALWLEHRVPRRATTEDRLLVAALAGHLGLAIQHARQFETARETSLTLQRAMLSPTQPPAGFAVRYEPAVPPLEIGGDWYDVLPLGAHQIGIILGDCVGRGLSAAAVMGQLRSSARALLLAGAEPALLLEQLDAAAALIPDAVCTTVFAGVLDTDSAVLRYSSAGHPPAVLASPGSPATLLAAARSVPLGVHREDPRPQESEALPAGSTLMVFTDGLVERRDRSIDDGINRAADVLMDALQLPVESVADVVLREMAPPSGYDDDVAIVICRPHAPLRLETDADAERLAGIRRRLTAWLRAAGVPGLLVTDIVLAVSEALTNSIEHAYRGHADGTVVVEAQIAGDEIQIRVVDGGAWKTPGPNTGNRGRGLPIIRAVSDRVDVDSSADGTTIDMAFSLTRAASGGESGVS